MVDGDSRFCEFCGEIIISPEITYNNINRENLSESNEKAGQGEMIVGLVLTIIGGVITWVSYSFASDGGTYYVFWGLIVYGVYKMIKGASSFFS
jgi:hypothetical protein